MSDGRDADRRSASYNRRSPRELLYVKQYVALADYARDVASGAVFQYAKLPPDEKVRRFGSTIVPIFVPLAPGETKRQYEQRFAAWLKAQHGFTVRELETHDDDGLERVYRVRFAKANARGHARFDPRDPAVDNSNDTDKRRLRPSPHSDQRRDDYHDHDHDRDRNRRRDHSDRERPPSPRRRRRSRSASPAPSSHSSSHYSARHNVYSNVNRPTPVEKRPPRELLYVKKYVPLADYTRDFQNRTVAAFAKLPIEEKRRLFGSSVVPIYVPLALGESKAQYEARFATWVQRHHGFTVEQLERHDDENLERFYRMRFAAANAKGDEAFDMDDHDTERRSLAHSSRDTDDSDTHGRSHRHRDQDDRYDRRRSLSPVRSQSTSSSSIRSRDVRTDRNERPHTTHAERSVRSPAGSHSPSGLSTQRYGRHPSTGERVPRDALYVKKYVELDQFELDFGRQKIQSYTKLPDQTLLELFGSTIVPIYVPLARGESMRQYEARFVEWIERRGYSLHELEHHADASLERTFRIEFAAANATREESFRPQAPTKRERPVAAESSPRPAKKPERADDRPTSFTTVAASMSSAMPARDGSVTAATSESSASQRDCSFVEPTKGAPTDDITAAYIACGCRHCLVTGTRFIYGKVGTLGTRNVCVTCTASRSDAGANGRRVMDLTQDDDRQSPRHRSRSGFAAAIARVVTAKAIAETLQQQLTDASSKKDDDDDAWLVMNDPMEKQLANAYDEINQTVLAHEKKLGDLAAQIARTPITDITETTRLQDQRQALRETIQHDSDRRTAALAVVMAHIWRTRKHELDQRLGDAQNKNVLHTQRTSHETCAKLSTSIHATQQRIGPIQKELDAVVATRENDTALVALSRAGHALTTAEAALRELLRQRRDVLTTLLAFDEQLRQQIHGLLPHGDGERD